MPTRRHALLIISGLCALALTSLWLALIAGSIEVSLSDTFRALFGSSDTMTAEVVRKLRLPRALTGFACGGLLAGVWGDVKRQSSAVLTAWLALLAIYSVAWWYFTEQAGDGDLRPYLMFQVLPMVLIPLWQWLYQAPTADRLSFGTALLLYAVAKVTELHDHEIAEATGLLTGHTIKHLLATAAAALIVARLAWRSRPAKA